jgi:hypothetical protein
MKKMLLNRRGVFSILGVFYMQISSYYGAHIPLLIYEWIALEDDCAAT